MPKVPFELIKESYQLRATFFYNKLTNLGFFSLFMDVKSFGDKHKSALSWSKRSDWGISEEAWHTVKENRLEPYLAFVHPKVMQLCPEFLKYYRCIAMLPQKGLSTLASVSNVNKIENGSVNPGTLTTETISKLTKCINEIISLVLILSENVDEEKLKGMMYTTAGTNIDGSWRNAIGAEGERVVRTIIVKSLLDSDEIVATTDKKNRTKEIADWDKEDLISSIEMIRTLTVTNGNSVLFSSEPDVTLYNQDGDVLCGIEIKAGIDPAGALERLGAMFKSFDNILSEYPSATTILIASCITDEVEARIGAARSVRQRYIMNEVIGSEKNIRKFSNNVRSILGLIDKGM